MQLQQHRTGPYILIVARIRCFNRILVRATGCESLQWALNELNAPERGPVQPPMIEPWQVKLKSIRDRCAAVSRRMADETEGRRGKRHDV